ncbi:MAG: hypothetical protein IJI33_01720 [Solobacterium sp.]|nr:hypothetical protein [Solobacterium sp.]
MKKLFALLLALVMMVACASALADWPERDIELIVPANPGGDTDANQSESGAGNGTAQSGPWEYPQRGPRRRSRSHPIIFFLRCSPCGPP